MPTTSAYPTQSRLKARRAAPFHACPLDRPNGLRLGGSLRAHLLPFCQWHRHRPANRLVGGVDISDADVAEAGLASRPVWPNSPDHGTRPRSTDCKSSRCRRSGRSLTLPTPRRISHADIGRASVRPTPARAISYGVDDAAGELVASVDEIGLAEGSSVAVGVGSVGDGSVVAGGSVGEGSVVAAALGEAGGVVAAGVGTTTPGTSHFRT